MVENICVTDSAARMGRPSLGVKFTAIRLSPEVLARIDAIMGAPGKRSEFIREAVERELERRSKG
jgi:metal-responsive CopG/Arc/MetJ family transcriptional regulator